jgi:hypothetical protein
MQSPESKIQNIQEFLVEQSTLLSLVLSEFDTSTKVNFSQEQESPAWFNMELQTIFINSQWMEAHSFTNEQSMLAVVHEMMHYQDFLTNPTEFVASVNSLKNTAIKLAYEYRKNPKNSSVDLNDLNNYFFNQIALFWNGINDIQINRRSISKLSVLNDEILSDLYSRVLAPIQDYQSKPMFEQIAPYLLRQNVVKGSKTLINPALQLELEQANPQLNNLSIAQYNSAISMKQRVAGSKPKFLEYKDLFNHFNKVILPVFNQKLLEHYSQNPEQLQSDIEQNNLDNPLQARQEQSEPEASQIVIAIIELRESISDKEGEDTQSQESQSTQSQDQNSGQPSDSGQDGQSQESQDQENGKSSEQQGQESNQEGNDKGHESSNQPQNAQNSSKQEQGQPSSQKPSNKNMPSSFMPTNLKDLDQLQQKAKQQQENNQSKQQKETEQTQEQLQNQREQAQKNDTQNTIEQLKSEFKDTNISQSDIKNYLKISDETFKHSQGLETMWNTFIGSQIGEFRQDSLARQGKNVNINAVMRTYNFLKIGDQTDLPKVFDRTTIFDSPEAGERLKELTVTFVLDCSGSMFNTGAIRELKNVYTGVMNSIEYYKQSSHRRRRKGELLTDIRTQTFVYGDDVKVAKNLSTHNSKSDKQELIKSLSAIKNMGENCDDVVISVVLDSLQQFQKLENKNLVLYITDGRPDSISRTKESLAKAIEQKNTFWRAFYIGPTSESNMKPFNELWNAGQINTSGIDVKLENLQQQILKSFSDFIL